jgi:hypothetical protein
MLIISMLNKISPLHIQTIISKHPQCATLNVTIK